MSSDVSMKGKLVPVDLEGKTLEEKAFLLIPEDERANVEKYGYDSALEYLQDEEESYYFDKASGILFEISILEEDYTSFMELTPNSDGSYDFLTRFYDGGTHLGEMLDDGFKELSEEDAA
jgi:hypothetical protein